MSEQVTCRLDVRRVKRLNTKAHTGQGELFDTYRYHTSLTNSTLAMLEADERQGLSNKRCIWGCFRGQWEWADRRPLKVMSKALRALFQRWVHRALPLPVGSRAMTAM